MTKKQVIEVEDTAVKLYKDIFGLILEVKKGSHAEHDLTSIMYKAYEIIQDLSEYRRTYIGE